jgi:ABC-type transporter Mla subunit MlaD
MTSEFFPEESQKKLESLVEDIRAFVGNANHIIGDPNNQRHFKTTLANLSKTSEAFPDAVDHAIVLMKDAQKTMEDFRRLAATGGETLKSADGKVEQLVGSMVATSNEIGKTVGQLRLAMEKVNDGQGSAARLINDGRLYESLLEDTTQLNLLLKDLKTLIDKVSEKGLRSIY